jgi:hypothetical protein
MLPLSVSDIVKLLEQVPGWKAVIGLPKRLADLEARVGALEKGGPSRSGPRPTECPRCGATLSFVGERKDPIFGVVGVMRHDLKCDGCGFETSKEWTQDKGYG